MSGAPDWARDGADWPNRQASRFVEAGGLRWHVQVMGSGPVLLLLHGTGAATHSWRDLAPLLARDFTVVAPDLPGHGFTSSPGRAAQSLPGMAAAVAALLRALNLTPALAAGHSAGAAVLARLALDGAIAPSAIIALNGALLPLEGAAGHLFSPLARLLVGFSAVPAILSWVAADPAVVDRLLDGTGSRLDARGRALYARLLRRPRHIGAALGMMAHWQLERLARQLPKLPVPLLLVVGANDRTVPPAEARRVQAMVHSARRIALPGLGHLAHEEQPAAVAALIAAELPAQAAADCAA
jgi:magnesium chelatase accessory protein